MVAMRTMWLLVLIFVASCAANGPRPEVSHSLPPAAFDVPAQQFEIVVLGNEDQDRVRMKYSRGANPLDDKVADLTRVKAHLEEWLDRSAGVSAKDFRECRLEMRIQEAWHLRLAYGFFSYAIQIAFDLDSRLVCDGDVVFVQRDKVRSESNSFLIWNEDDGYHYPQSMFRTFAKGITQFFEAYRSPRSIEEEAEGSEE